MKCADVLRLEDLLMTTFCINSYEAELLAILLIYGDSTNGEISKKAEMPRSRMYDIAEKLQKKGFIKIDKMKKLKKTNRHSKFHKDYVKPLETRYIPFNLQEIIINQKEQMQSQLNEKFKVMNTFKEDIRKQLDSLKNGKVTK